MGDRRPGVMFRSAVAVKVRQRRTPVQSHRRRSASRVWGVVSAKGVRLMVMAQSGRKSVLQRCVMWS